MDRIDSWWCKFSTTFLVEWSGTSYVSSQRFLVQLWSIFCVLGLVGWYFTGSVQIQRWHYFQRDQQGKKECWFWWWYSECVKKEYIVKNRTNANTFSSSLSCFVFIRHHSSFLFFWTSVVSISSSHSLHTQLIHTTVNLHYLKVYIYIYIHLLIF